MSSGLYQIRDKDLDTTEKGIFADIKRPRDGGKGLDGVFQKAPGYRNPFMEPMMKGGAR